MDSALHAKTADKLVALLKSAIQRHGGDSMFLDSDDIDLEANMYETYGIDSLTGVAFMIEVQRFFKLRIPADVAETLTSLSAVRGYLITAYEQAS